MNVERIRELADVIEAQKHAKLRDTEGFNMGNWTHHCGTPACICGWANHLRNQELGVKEYLGRTDYASNWLGIDQDTSGSLFRPEHPDPFHGDDWWEDITPAHAAAVLRHLANTGEVDWSVTAPTEGA